MKNTADEGSTDVKAWRTHWPRRQKYSLSLQLLTLAWSILPHLTSLIGSGIISFAGRAIHLNATPTVEIGVIRFASQLFLANVLNNIIGVGRATI